MGECGNSRPFLTIVKELTGKELSGSPWVHHLQESVEDKIQRAKKEYDEAIQKQQKAANNDSADTIDLNMTVRFVDGDELIADSSVEGGIFEACKKFETFVAGRVAAASS